MARIGGFLSGLTVFLLVFHLGCGDDSATPSDCVNTPGICPEGSRCVEDTMGNGACIPDRQVGTPDAFLLTDMGSGGGNSGNQAGASGQGGASVGGGDGMGGANAGAGGDTGGASGGQTSGGSTGSAGAAAGGTAGNGNSQGGNGGTDGGGSGNGDRCRDVSILLKPSRAPANTARIMLAVDRSGSVVDWNGWNATLEGIDTTMSLLGEGVQFGLTLFPHPYGGQGPNSECRPARVDQSAGYDTADAIQRLLRAGRPEA